MKATRTQATVIASSRFHVSWPMYLLTRSRSNSATGRNKRAFLATMADSLPPVSRLVRKQRKAHKAQFQTASYPHNSNRRGLLSVWHKPTR